MSAPALKVDCQQDLVEGTRVCDALGRAIAELAFIRASTEDAFEQIRSHAHPDALGRRDYILAMQRVDALSQHLAAIETFIGNVAGVVSADEIVPYAVATRGITLSAIAERLSTQKHLEGEKTSSGVCDFF